MNDITPPPRDAQTPISFRSDLAARLLAEMTRDGRSEAEVIEAALASAANARLAPAVPAAARERLSREQFRARIDAIVQPLHGLPGRSREEIEAEMYDEHGAPR